MKFFPAALFLALLLGGCSLPVPLMKSPTVYYYVLSTPQTEAAHPVDGQRIGVVPVSLSGYLNRPQIVTRSEDGVNIQISDFHRWGEELNGGISRIVCETLTEEGHPAIALRTGAHVDCRLLLDIRRLDGPLNGNVMLDAIWTLQKDRKILLSGHVKAQRPAGGTMDKLVEAQSWLIRHLAREVAKTLP